MSAAEGASTGCIVTRSASSTSCRQILPVRWRLRSESRRGGHRGWSLGLAGNRRGVEFADTGRSINPFSAPVRGEERYSSVSRRKM